MGITTPATAARARVKREQVNFHEYLDERDLAERLKSPRALVSWWYHKKLRTVRSEGNLFSKLRFCEPDVLEELRDAGARLGIRRDKFWPSSFADLFHEPHPIIPMNYSTLHLMPKDLPGPWEESRAIFGEGPWYEYDLNSAYAWAGMTMLPCHRSAWPVRTWSGPGLYFAKVVQVGSVVVPPHVRQAEFDRRPIWMSHEEIEKLDVRVEVLRGFTFAEWWDGTKRINAIIAACRSRGLWKAALRAYWGKWCSPFGGQQKSHKSGSVRALGNPWYDPACAHFILSRVRIRLSEIARNAVHIFVDAAITRDVVRTGDQIGDWKLKNTFRRLTVRHAGNWRGETLDAATVEKHSGEKRRAV